LRVVSRGIGKGEGREGQLQGQMQIPGPLRSRGALSQDDGGLGRVRADLVSTRRDEAGHGWDSGAIEGWRGRSEAGRVCGNAGCGRGWFRFWQDRRRPMFEGRWGCSRECLTAMVAAAVRRASADGGVGDGGPDENGGLASAGDGREVEDGARHRHRVPLGLVLLAQGWISHPQLRYALEAQRRAGHGRLGRWLVAECGLAEERVTRALGMQWSCPVLRMEGFDPVAMALLAPRVLMDRLGMVPVRIAAERILYLAFAEQLDASAALAMERMSGLKVESGLAGAAELAAARRRLDGCRFVAAEEERVERVEEVAGRMGAALARLRPRASRMVRVREFYWLRMWLESGAMRTEEGGAPIGTEDVMDRLVEVVGLCR
jgi:Type II secretion system (T2SS), protein E, N-terminal domain